MHLFRIGHLRRSIKYTAKAAKLTLTWPFLLIEDIAMVVAAPFVAAYYVIKEVVVIIIAIFNFFHTRRTFTNAFHKRPKPKATNEPSYIRIPKGLTPYNKQYYYVIFGTFRAAGFSNIICLNLEDIDGVTSYKEEQVAEVTINGDEVRPGMGPFPSDIPIIVTYHGKKVRR